MSAALTIPMDEETLARVDEIATLQETTRQAVVEQALASYLDKMTPPDDDDDALAQIEAGIAEAERGDFASDEEVEQAFKRTGR